LGKILKKIFVAGITVTTIRCFYWGTLWGTENLRQNGWFPFQNIPSDKGKC